MVISLYRLALLAVMASPLIAHAHGPEEDRALSGRLNTAEDLLERLISQGEENDRRDDAQELRLRRLEVLRNGASNLTIGQLRQVAKEAEKESVYSRVARFEELLLQLICEQEKNCETRRKLAELELQLRRNQADLDRMVRDGKLAPVTFIDPQPTLADPQQGNQWSSPAPTLQPQQELVTIVARRSQICQNAKLVQKCFDLYLPDNSFYHGHLYRDCRGRLALVTHFKSLP